jgi:hypothetical protein
MSGRSRLRWPLMGNGGQLTADHDFATFLASRDLRRVRLEVFRQDPATFRAANYEAQTELWREQVLDGFRVKSAPYTFTAQQLAIAAAAYEKVIERHK